MVQYERKLKRAFVSTIQCQTHKMNYIADILLEIGGKYLVNFEATCAVVDNEYCCEVFLISFVDTALFLKTQKKRLGFDNP